MIGEIIYKQDTDKLPMPSEKVGFPGFIKELQKHGWIDDNEIVKRNFTVSYGHYFNDNGKPYVEWRAVLSEKPKKILDKGFISDLAKALDEYFRKAEE